MLSPMRLLAKTWFLFYRYFNQGSFYKEIFKGGNFPGADEIADE
jgi:hypothetical protein